MYVNTRSILLFVLEEQHTALAFCVDQYPDLVAYLDRALALPVTVILAVTPQASTGPLVQVKEADVVGEGVTCSYGIM